MFLRCKMHFYYINVDSQKVRNQNMIKQFEERNIKYTRIDAIKPEKEQPSKVDYERCCTRSHIKAIETFLKNEDGNHCVICEDDLSFEFECFWTKPLEEIVKDAPNNWGVIQIAYILQNIEPKFNGRAKYFNYKDLSVSGTLAYIINRKCALEILNVFIKRNFLPTADCFRSGIYASVEYNTQFDSYIYKYPMFTYPDNNDSLIGNSIELHVASKKQQIRYLKSILNI